VDVNRVLVLRTASNFCPARYVADIPALESAWRVGNAVVEELVKNWGRCRDTVP
jgi:purine nucleoside permease